MNALIAVGAGSCLGGIARYLLSKIVQTAAGGVFPWGTFVVNILGCFIIGFVYGAIDRGFALPDWVRLFVTVGFCGGFTTFSTFMNENYLLFGAGRLGLVMLYAAASLVTGLAMTYSGYWLAGRIGA